MTWIGVALFLVGLVVTPLSCFYLAGTAFVSSGRHAREQLEFDQGVEQRLSFEAKAGELLADRGGKLVVTQPYVLIQDHSSPELIPAANVKQVRSLSDISSSVGAPSKARTCDP